VALQAERMELAPGDVWVPRPDSSPHGPHFGVVTKGNAWLEIVSCRRQVVKVFAKGLLLEGLISEFGACVRAATHLEGYRFRESDLLLAAVSVGSDACHWFDRFELIQKETHHKFSLALKSASGVNSLGEHPDSIRLRAWKVRKTRALDHAKCIREDRAGKFNSPIVLPMYALPQITRQLSEGSTVPSATASRPRTPSLGLQPKRPASAGAILRTFLTPDVPGGTSQQSAFNQTHPLPHRGMAPNSLLAASDLDRTQRPLQRPASSGQLLQGRHASKEESSASSPPRRSSAETSATAASPPAAQPGQHHNSGATGARPWSSPAVGRANYPPHRADSSPAKGATSRSTSRSALRRQPPRRHQTQGRCEPTTHEMARATA
jgi:hypothetical protein